MRDGKLIGLNFDSNWEAVSASWMFDPRFKRAIHVDMRYLRWLLAKVYPAPHLLQGNEPARRVRASGNFPLERAPVPPRVFPSRAIRLMTRKRSMRKLRIAANLGRCYSWSRRSPRARRPGREDQARRRSPNGSTPGTRRP